MIEAKITRAKEIKNILSLLSEEDVRQIIDTIELRVDNESFFYMRLDKQEAYLGNLRLSSGEDVISVRGKIKSYPQNRENAVLSITQTLQTILDKKELKRS